MQFWQPTTTHQARIARAALLRTIREFFYTRNVLEVDTPLLSKGTVTDEHLEAFDTCFNYDQSGKPTKLYLQTSPEYAMKRLLCADSGSIYQICKAFRHESEGRWHNPEFTMLEWYRVGFDHVALMDEVDALLQETLGTEPSDKMSYQQAFQTYLNIDPLCANDEELLEAMEQQGIDIHEPETLSFDSKLQLLFSYIIEPQIGSNTPCFIYDFPATQAALARLNSDDPRVAERFEVYFKGAELANGFNELNAANEQRKRFENDNEKRRASGLSSKPIDENFLNALEAGLPLCSGVALGVDRLLMLKTEAKHISDVINFPVSRA
ncbi:elongation factor P--(R)-beta-lysine ligase [Alteromonas sp. KUL106]|uniref:elongation factor P--(R)-beta-lysine ligase n=1 Tax=Alteromonas sp. KUL106 TaxID=2480799 RepID=UPI0012E649D3|nr:elongation factor P--(R)-beta-lysine ligase [Alteromonas sp. KUL106]GFD67571.1 elongation factor P--(R)-beta-lysine ligase [Alteromonas sp. KUL106]GFD77873.1 elongation factor P--(R)-beta-lysine ligase [Tenacibaculum sp. KUL118]